MILGDAASRDAAIHCIQACIPHKTVLPAEVEAVEIHRNWTGEAAIVHAEQRSQDKNDFIYDVRIEDASGLLCESWKGLRLHAVAQVETDAPWKISLLAPYLERRLADLLPDADARITLAVSSQKKEAVAHRPDGKPEDPSSPGLEISRSHANGLCLTARSKSAIGCDLEECTALDEKNWNDLLGAQGFSLAETIASSLAISVSLAATQIWTLMESLRKAGAPLKHLLQIEAHFADGWTVLSCNDVRAAIFHASIQGFRSGFAFGFTSRRAQ
jgi:enediyne polyketide synthase